LFSGEKNLVRKTTFVENLTKGDFSGFTPKPLPIADFGLNQWKERVKYNQKKLKLSFDFLSNFKTLICHGFS